MNNELEKILICNVWGRLLSIALEPEGDIFNLPPGGTLEVYFKKGCNPVVVYNHHNDYDLEVGPEVISVWATNESYAAFYNGRNVSDFRE